MPTNLYTNGVKIVKKNFLNFFKKFKKIKKKITIEDLKV